MYLFLDTLSAKTCIFLFSQEREVVDMQYQDFFRREFEDLPDAIDSLLKKNDVTYAQIV